MPEDRQDVFDHAIDRTALQLAGEAEAAVNDHPGVEELVAYQERRLTSEDAESVRQHLVACSQCAREVLELEEFHLDEPGDAALLPSPEETTEDWVDFRRRVTLEPPEVGFRADRVSWWVLAASVAVAAGIGYWAAVLNQGDGAAPSPLLIPAYPLFHDLVPDREALSRDAAPGILLERSVDQLLLRLNLGDQTPHDTYRAEIFDAVGASVWNQPQLRRQPAGQFIVPVPRGKLSSDRYRVELIGTRGGEDIVLATYTLVLSNVPDP